MDGRLFFFLVRQRQIIEWIIKFFDTRPNGGKEGKRCQRPSLVGREVYTIITYPNRNFARIRDVSINLKPYPPNWRSPFRTAHIGHSHSKKDVVFFRPGAIGARAVFLISCFDFSIVGLEFASARVFHIRKLWFFLLE